MSKWPYFANAVFGTAQNHGDKVTSVGFRGRSHQSPPLDPPLWTSRSKTQDQPHPPPHSGVLLVTVCNLRFKPSMILGGFMLARRRGLVLYVLFKKQSLNSRCLLDARKPRSNWTIKDLRPAMSNPWPAGRMRPSRGFCATQLRFSLYYCQPVLIFYNAEFVIFDAGGAQCHFITSVTIAIRIRTLLVC